MDALPKARPSRAGRRPLAMLLAAALAGGCGEATPERAPGTAPTAAAGAAAALPLPRGFYVALDTPCGEASNATLALLHRDGLNGARSFCEFTRVEPTGTASFRITESCRELGVDEDHASVVDWEILSPQSFRRVADSGWVSAFRFCEQSSLPEPWRDNDIADLID